MEISFAPVSLPSPLCLSRHSLETAPLFSKVNASLTTPQSCEDMKGMFSNFVNELASIRQRK
jgi:hypothetical protein